MSEQHNTIYLSIIFLVIGCSQAESKFSKATKTLGVEISQTSDFNIENVDHLIFLYQHATEKKITARDMMRSAYDVMLQEPESFPLVTYTEALLNYPTIASLLGTANGYLRTADRSLKMASGDFTNIDESGIDRGKHKFEDIGFDKISPLTCQHCL